MKERLGWQPCNQTRGNFKCPLCPLRQGLYCLGRPLSTDAGADKNFTPQTVAAHGPSVFRRGFVVFNLLTQ